MVIPAGTGSLKVHTTDLWFIREKSHIEAPEKTTRFVTLWEITILTEREVGLGKNLHGFST